MSLFALNLVLHFNCQLKFYISLMSDEPGTQVNCNAARYCH